MLSNETISVMVGAALLIVTAGSSRPAGQGRGDACALLTPSQVTTVLGVSVGAGQRLVASSPLSCGWAQPGDTSHRGKRVVISILGPLGKVTPVERFANGKKDVQGITKTPVAGVGDDAYYVTTPGLGTGLNVKKGTAAFEIRVYGFSPDQIKAMEKTLAENALAKL